MPGTQPGSLVGEYSVIDADRQVGNFCPFRKSTRIDAKQIRSGVGPFEGADHAPNIARIEIMFGVEPQIPVFWQVAQQYRTVAAYRLEQGIGMAFADRRVHEKPCAAIQRG